MVTDIPVEFQTTESGPQLIERLVGEQQYSVDRSYRIHYRTRHPIRLKCSTNQNVSV